MLLWENDGSVRVMMSSVWDIQDCSSAYRLNKKRAKRNTFQGEKVH